MSLTGRIKKAAKAFNKDDEFSEKNFLTPDQSVFDRELIIRFSVD